MALPESSIETRIALKVENCWRSGNRSLAQPARVTTNPRLVAGSFSWPCVWDLSPAALPAASLDRPLKITIWYVWRPKDNNLLCLGVGGSSFPTAQHLNCALAPGLQFDALELRNPPAAAWLERHHFHVQVVCRMSHSEADARKLHIWPCQREALWRSLGS